MARPLPSTTLDSYGKATLPAIRDVVRHEFQDTIRNRRAIVLLLLYLLGSMTTALLFFKMLNAAAAQLTSQTKGMLHGDAILQNTRILSNLAPPSVRNQSWFHALLSLPPAALFFQYFTLTFLPWLVVFSASARVSEELASGSVRFVAIRVSRLNWILGKYIGQALQLLVAVLLSSLVISLTAMWKLPSVDFLECLVSLIAIVLKVWIYGLAFLGIALGISQVSAAPMLPTMFGFIAICGCALVNALGGIHSENPVLRVCHFLAFATPNHYRNDLWTMQWTDAIFPLAIILALAFAFLATGYFFFRRRDL